MKPLIGVSPSISENERLYQISSHNISAISKAGGMPIILPYVTNENDIKQMVQTIDGLYITGGTDVDPNLYGEEPHQKLETVYPTRDNFEQSIIKETLMLDKPILGVCRGCQILNVAAGGNLYQDIYSQISGNLIQHYQKSPKGHGSHEIHIRKDSLLHQLVGVERWRVNSRHHQASKNIVNSFQVSAKTIDGIIEAIESKEHTFVLGLQWHPENMVSANDQLAIKIYEGFIKSCEKKKH